MAALSLLHALCGGIDHALHGILASHPRQATFEWAVQRFVLTEIPGIRNAPVPFFIRPVTNSVANRVSSLFLEPNFKTHYAFLEEQLKSSPDSGEYLCGKHITAADILMSFPLEAGQSRSGMSREQCPLMWAYVDRLHEREAYKRSIKKIEDIEGSFKSNL